LEVFFRNSAKPNEMTRVRVKSHHETLPLDIEAAILGGYYKAELDGKGTILHSWGLPRMLVNGKVKGDSVTGVVDFTASRVKHCAIQGISTLFDEDKDHAEIKLDYEGNLSANCDITVETPSGLATRYEMPKFDLQSQLKGGRVVINRGEDGALTF